MNSSSHVLTQPYRFFDRQVFSFLEPGRYTEGIYGYWSAWPFWRQYKCYVFLWVTVRLVLWRACWPWGTWHRAIFGKNNPYSRNGPQGSLGVAVPATGTRIKSKKSRINLGICKKLTLLIIAGLRLQRRSVLCLLLLCFYSRLRRRWVHRLMLGEQD